MHLLRILSVATTLVLPLALAKPNKYCEGEFAQVPKNCAKFDFKPPKSSACSKDNIIKLANCTTFYDISKLPDESIDPHTIKMAELITNVFENGNTQMGYAAVEKLGDCRGYTCGYIGFTTGTNDAWTVVKEYVKRQPKDNKLEKFLDELARLSGLPFGDPGRDDTSKLDGFPEAWKASACDDPLFVRTQLDVGTAMYLKPAMKYAASAGVHSNLGKFIFYDTIIQHGWQYVEPDINLPRILELTGPKKADETEAAYLTRFLTTRRQLVCCYPGDVWNESSDREADLQTLVDHWDQNKDLMNPVHLVIFGETVKGTENMNYDAHSCKKPFKRLPRTEDLPIPDTCPN
ncbi:hypothetical protein EC973_002036 [Apophysomyces ossiformis]|uniref:Chitosanase n=1 Tax=Apophysomyces ossiformis TaxID=679940 RepID=A0A8H7BL86_9FUNG|nr:hypothetical protein EC973_002036 [Apophysomyces ossiformis]